jgi:hypothetical protein
MLQHALHFFEHGELAILARHRTESATLARLLAICANGSSAIRMPPQVKYLSN